jgi:starch phosphorylase
MSDSARKVAINIRNPKKKVEEHEPHAVHHPHASSAVPPEEKHEPTPAKPTHSHTPAPHHQTPARAAHTSAPAKERKSLSKIISDIRDRSLSGMRKELDPQYRIHTEEVSVDTPKSTPEPEPEPEIDVTPSAVETALPTPVASSPEAPQVVATPAPIAPPPAPVVDTPVVQETPRSFVVPKKPSLLEGVNMSACSVAYFCMEIALENEMPTYAGGLGVLAGDMLKSCADLRVPVVGVTLLYRKGFFRQEIDENGWQHEMEEVWDPSRFLTLLPQEITLSLEGRTVRVRAWLYKVKGVNGNIVPVLFLDTDVAGNSDEDRHITDRLYDSDQRWRLLQEAVLGIGGARILEAVGATRLEKYHMNEGHAALLTLELYRRFEHFDEPTEEVRARAVFTTHTPVAAGHDRFEQGMVNRILGVEYIPAQINNAVFEGGVLNMTRLGFNFSNHINGVAKKHGAVTRELFPGYRVESITNGVYARDWVSPAFARLFDRYLPGWQSDPHSLRYVLSIPLDAIAAAHAESKQTLINYVNDQHHAQMRPEYFTIGFARRAASYKRAHMLFSDIDRLTRIARNSKGIQIIFAGKAHPADNEGKLVIQRVVESMRKLGTEIRCVYIEDYDMEIGKLLVSGVDLWLNTPTRPQEASGTSGMKAALNGVPQLSILDGWWLEGHIEHVTGWSIGIHPERGSVENPDADDAEDMYAKLEQIIVPRFEHERDEWTRVMRQTIAINGSFFNSHRMVEQYVLGAYFIS